ncbi:MAG: hypothetical protein ACHQIM_10030 [Sphingobacteriales bacterium]
MKIYKILPLNPFLKGLCSSLQQEEYAGYPVDFVRPFQGYGTSKRTDTIWRAKRPLGIMFNTKIKDGNELDADTVLSVLVWRQCLWLCPFVWEVRYLQPDGQDLAGMKFNTKVKGWHEKKG